MSAHGDTSSVKPTTRLFVWLFLAAFAICGIFGFELWPMTGWRLFADARKQHHVSWSSDVEYADGTTNGLALRAAGSTDTSFLIGRLDELPSDDRDHLCEEWLEVATADQHVRRILIYRITRDLGARDGGQGADPTRKLAYVCEDKKLIRPSA